MADFTEISTQSWFSRITGSIGQVLVGFLLFLLSFPLLWFNEGCAVATYQRLQEGSGAVVEISASEIIASQDGSLVHISGKAETSETLSDPEFSIQQKALRLRRKVEMYQWEEDTRTKKEKNLGGSETTKKEYRYEKVWSDDLIDSSRFKRSGHSNPSTMTFRSAIQTASNVSLGDFSLTPSIVSQMSGFQELPIPSDLKLPPGAQKQGDQTIYIGQNPSSPAIGDLRIRFSYIPETEVSIIAQQKDQSLRPYASKAGGNIELVQMGMHSAESMFAKAQSDSDFMTWGLRVGGFFLMFIGINLVFSPLVVVADIVPILGRILGAGSMMISGIIALGLSFATIAVAWIFYRPLLAGALILVTALAAASLFFFRRSSSPKIEETTSAPVEEPPSSSVPPSPATTPVQQSSLTFFLYIGEETVGPLTHADLTTKLSSHEITPETPCCREGSSEWKTVADFT